MTALSTTILIATLTIILASANAQANDQFIRKLVLRKAIVDSNFIFGKWKEDGGMETHLKYLGQVTTKHGKVFKIVNSMWFWGVSHRLTSRILIFTDNNQYVGNYYVTVASGLPSKMRNGSLIFNNTDEDCNSKLTTIVNLKNGLPKHLFRKCQNDYGDMYSFDND